MHRDCLNNLPSGIQLFTSLGTILKIYILMLLHQYLINGPLEGNWFPLLELGLFNFFSFPVMGIFFYFYP